MKHEKNFEVTKDTQFAILGLGKFGITIAKILFDNNFVVLGCDINAHVVNEASQFLSHVVQVDVTDAIALDQLSIGNFDAVIIAVSDDFEASALATMYAKEQNVPFVLAKANGIRQQKILENVGADRVILPEIEIGERIAYDFISNDPMQYIHNSDHYHILELRPEKKWIGKTLKELNLRNKRRINVLAIIRDDEVLRDMQPLTTFEENDIVVVLYTDAH